MTTKLTLSLDETVIGEAKSYARQHQTSLSRLIAHFLRSLKSASSSSQAVSPVVKEISGILPRSLNTQKLVKQYHRHLEGKYR